MELDTYSDRRRIEIIIGVPWPGASPKRSYLGEPVHGVVAATRYRRVRIGRIIEGRIITSLQKFLWIVTVPHQVELHPAVDWLALFLLQFLKQPNFPSVH